MIHAVLVLVLGGIFFAIFGRLASAGKRIAEKKTNEYQWLENTILTNRSLCVVLAVGILILASGAIYIVSKTPY